MVIDFFLKEFYRSLSNSKHHILFQLILLLLTFY